MNHLGTQTIETERLILRKARPEDAQAMFDNWASDEKVTKFMTWQTYAKPEEAEWRISYLLGEYANDNFYEWFIELKEIGQPIFFEQVGVNRVEACHDVNNPKSGRVMLKCGMTYEGTLRQSGWNNQGINDRAFYGILRDEYFAGKKEKVR